MPNNKIFHFLGMKMYQVIPSFHFNVADCEMNYGQCLWPNCPPVFKLCYLIRGKGQEDVHFLLSG